MATVTQLESQEETHLEHTIYSVKLSKIIPFPGQPRQHFDQKGIIELAVSIEEKGQQTPIVLCRNPEYPGEFMLVGGERRCRAFKLISERQGNDPKIRAVFKPFTDVEELLRDSLLDNLHRDELCSLDEARAYAQLHNDYGDPISKIAKMMGKSTSHVKNYILVDGLPDEVKKLMDPNLPRAKQLRISAAIIIAQGVPVANEKMRLALASEAVEAELPVHVIEQLVGIRTGHSGFGVGGSNRSPTSDYKSLTGFLGRTKNQLKRQNGHPALDDLFSGRDDYEKDTEEANANIDYIIGQFSLLRKKINGDD